MTPRRALFVGLALVAISVVWLASRYAGRLDSRLAAGAAPASQGGGKMTLQFFRNPATVGAVYFSTLDGRELSSDGFRGRVTIVNFWATWCPPCRAEIPDLIALQEKYRDRLQIIGVSEDEGGPEVVKRFVADHQMNYPIVMTTPALEKAFPGVSALPTSFFLDRSGRIVQKHVGMLEPARTEDEMRALAGLPVDAAIEQVDSTQKLEITNAQLTTIPGVDLSALSPDQRTEALEQLNAQACTCGCDLTIARCRVDDPTCGISLPIARQIVARIAGHSAQH